LRLQESNQQWEIPMPADLQTFLEGLAIAEPDRIDH
jgi:hypothetical protein